MSETNAIDGYGTLIKRGDGGTPETFTTIAEVMNVDGPGMAREMIDATHHDGVGWDEVIPGVPSVGTISLDISYVPTNGTHDASTGIIADFESGAKKNYQLVFPDSGATTWSFACYVQDVKPTAPVKGRLSAAVTLRITGAPTLA